MARPESLGLVGGVKGSVRLGRVLVELGERVRSARLAAGLTQETAASRAGIDYKRYQRIEGGRVNVTVRTLVRLADALGSDFWSLVCCEGARELSLPMAAEPPPRYRPR